MKKAITICLLFVSTITFTSFTKSYQQANEFPPIQGFLDKVKKVKYAGDPMTISQKLSDNVFIYKTDWIGIQTKETYQEIDWSHFELYTKIVDNDYVECEFNFPKKIKYNYSDDESIEENKEVNSFTCFILLKDKVEFLKVIEDWKYSRD